MSRYVSEALRQVVAARADSLCEYCLIHEEDTLLGCQVDHIIGVKHGGLSELANLALACAFCNRHKGSNLGSLLRRTGALVRFFNPRLDRWGDHFQLDGALIRPASDVGEVTAFIFGFNSGDRVLERKALIAVGRYPTAAALARMRGSAIP